MASNLKNFDSVGGFSVSETELIDSLKNFKNVHSLKIQNSNFSNSSSTAYILSGQNTGILSIDGGTQSLTLPNNTVNFITTNVVGTNQTGGGVLVTKIESAVTVNSVGDVNAIGILTTVIRDTVPTGQAWSVTPFDSGAAGAFSYSTSRTGTTSTIKWVAYTQVVSIDHT